MVKSNENSFATFLDGFDPDRIQHDVNRDFLDRKGDNVITRWEAVKEALLQRYGRAAPALELEVSLDLQQYVVRRTLVVSEDTTFGVLHKNLKMALRWEDTEQHQFVLPPKGDRTAPLHVLGNYVDHKIFPEKEPYVWGEEVRLSEQLQEGDCFRYVHLAHHADIPWNVTIRVRRRIPSAEEDLPICTLCEGKAPPEWVNGVDGYREFCTVLDNPDDPRCVVYAAKAGLAWLLDDTPADITERFHRLAIIL